MKYPTTMRPLFCLAILCLCVPCVYLQALNCYVPADIMLLLDGSDSIQDRDWQTMKDFTQQLIANFDVAADAIHIGMVVYSSDIGDHIGLNSFKDKDRLRMLAGVLKQPKASTNTARGIEYVREKLRTDGRTGVPKIIIVITDGSSDNPRDTARQANMAKMEGVKVIAVGVGGQMFRDELRQIASNPRTKVFTSPTFGTLVTLISEIRRMVCQVITTTTSTTTTPVVPTLPPVYVTTPKGRHCDVPGDIVFLMDGSDSINDADFIRQKAFVANMIDNFEIGAEAIHVGMVVYSTMIGETVGLQQSRSKNLLKIFAKSLKHPKVGTNTARGIERVRKMMREEGRSFAPKVMVVITDGRSTNPAKTVAQANLAKVEGISVIAIGVGTAIFRDELRQIASNPTQVFEVVDFEDLKQIITAMRDLICQEIKTTTTTTTTTELPTTPPLYPLPPGLICDVPADVGFLLDGSDSIDDRQWVKEKNFAANLVNNLDIGPNAIHAGAIVYSTMIGETINLTPFKPKALLKILLKRMKQPKVGTNTARAIEKMREMFRTQGRINAPKVMIIVTDGRSRSPQQTIAQASLAKAEGIIVIAVGVGTQVFRDELRQIATNERKLFEVSDFAALKQIIVSIRDLICQVISTPSITTTTPAPPPTTTLPHIIPGCDVPAEIMIMMHGGERTGDYNWNINKKFLQNMINGLYVRQGAHHVGYVVYSERVHDHIGLEPFKDKLDLKLLADKLVHPGRGANSWEGIKMMRDVFRKQGRKGAPKIGLLLTDAASTNPGMTQAEADLAKLEGVTMLTVGIGNRVNIGELGNIATKGKQIINVPSYEQLETILPELRHMICDVIKNPPPKPTPTPTPNYNFTSLCSGCLYDRGVGFNPYPGDCSKYVQCWIDMGQVRGMVKQCPFGQFWDSKAITCRPSMNVDCPQDPCLNAPNGFSYRMSGMGCRSYWLCLNGHSVGSCCPPASYYVSGMGCMRGMACNEPCPPDGGLIVTPNCNKEASWDERYYIETLPRMGKVVRPCAPGTRFSRAYCSCVANLDGLIPVLPGDKCRALALFTFDFDLKDKSGQNTMAVIQNVMRTIYGTAHFNGANSYMRLDKFAGRDLGDKLVIQMKFKFDRWGDDFDYGGLIVDMGKGDYQWRWDIDAGWTRNLTIGGGWDAEKLLKMFRRLFAARSEYEMNEIMIEIANSPDFRALLYQLGFVPEATNALQILRILISGRGSTLVQSILKQIGNVQGSEEIRRLLFNILQIEEMSNLIRDHTGKHHGHALQNWRKLINSLKLKDNDWNKGLLLRMILDNEINGGTIESRAKLIADLWRKFVTENGMDTADWRKNLIFTFTDDSANHGVNGYINGNLMDEIQKVLQGNGPVKNRWDDFLNKRNITVSWYQGPTGNKIITAKIIQDWLNWLTGNGNGGLDMTGGLGPYAGFTQSGIRNVADLWRRFVTDMDLDKDASLASLLRWTFTSDNHIPSPHNNLLLVNEMKNILADDNLRHKWLKFLENRDLTITDTPSGWEVVNGADTTKLANWLYWLFSSVSDHVTNDNGGLTESGIGHMADIWRTFITDMHLDQDSSLQPLLEWTFSGKGIQTPQDKELLITEIKKVLQHPNVRRMWLDFLNSRDINIVATGNGFDVVKGGTHNDAESWISWLIMSHGKNGQGQGGFLDFIENGNNGAILDQIIGMIGLGGRGTEFTTHGRNTLSNLWRQFITHMGIDNGNMRHLLVWTHSGHSDNSNMIQLLFQEMANILSKDNYFNAWIQHLKSADMNIVLNFETMQWDIVHGGVVNDIDYFVYWLFMTYGSSNTYQDNIYGFSTHAIEMLSQLWHQFITQQNLDTNIWRDYLVWSLNSDTTLSLEQNFYLLLQEMRMVLRSPKMRSAWLEYLRVRGYSLAVEHGVWTLSSDVYNSDMSEYNFYNWILWLYGNAFYSGVDSNYNIGGFYTNSGLNILMNLWKRFITNLKLDQSVWRQYLKWTFNSQSNVNPNTLTWKLMEEIRAVLSNRQYLNSWIDFMHEHNTYIVYTSQGWDMVKGSKINNIASWMYWLFITVGDLDLPAGHTDFGKHGGFSGNTNITFGTWQHNFLQRIFHYSQCCLINYYLSYIEHACPIYNNLTYSIFMHHSLTRSRTLCLPEILRACNNTHIFNFYINHSHTILTFVYRKNVAQSIFQSQSLMEYHPIGHNKTSQFYPYLCLKRFLEFTSFTEDYHGAYTLNGIKTLIILWRNFILRLLKIKLIKWQSLCSLLKDSAIPDDRDKYSALTKQMIDLFANDLFSKYWLEYVQYRNFSFVLRDGAWDIAQNCSRDQNQEWLTWILAQAQSDSRNDIRSWNSYASDVLLRNKRESGITGSWNMHGSAWGSGIATPIHLDMDGFGSWMDSDLFGAMLLAGGGGAHSADTSIESLDHILGSLSTGHGTNSGSSYYDSAEYHYNNYNNYGGGVTDYTGGLGLWALRDADINGFGSSEELVRKRREAKRSRSKRQASPTKFNYMSLLGNCGSQNPSIDISANERNVRMSLMTQGSGAPTTLEIPIVPSWNKLTLVYDGNKMTGTVENWRGKQRKEAALSGKIQSRSDGITIGSCSPHQNLRGQIDDLVMYKCIPAAINSRMGMSGAGAMTSMKSVTGRIVKTGSKMTVS